VVGLVPHCAAGSDTELDDITGTEEDPVDARRRLTL
jgi:hypothetical protein